MRPISEIRREARRHLGQRYGICVGSMLLVGLIGGGVNYLAGFLPVWEGLKNAVVALLLTHLLDVGLCHIYLPVVRQQPVSIDGLFTPFRRYGRNLGAMAWRYLWTVLWGLLVFPLLIKSMEYIMVPYLLADCPRLTARKALRMSRILADGHRWDLFLIWLAIYWPILLLLLPVYWIAMALGTGALLFLILALGLSMVLYFLPTYQAHFSQMYLALRDEALQRQILASEDFQ
jgi:uncharacterized membrane protein